MLIPKGSTVEFIKAGQSSSSNKVLLVKIVKRNLALDDKSGEFF